MSPKASFVCILKKTGMSPDRDAERMKYVLNERYRFRGWYKRPCGLYDRHRKEAFFPDRESYLLLLKCDGAHDLDPAALSSREKDAMADFQKKGIIRPARFGEFLRDDQKYTAYPARYRRAVHWSVTGACNMACRHCFMSAPGAKHGTPDLEEIIRIADQLAECGVFQAGITGGEPLIREDFFEIVDALSEREIGIDVIYTNGWLVDEKFLDEFERREVYPGFQISFDGVGCHDWLRGVPGAEERTIHALELLQKYGYDVSVSMCLHRKNCHTIRESVNLLAGLGVKSVKCGSMMELGEWMNPELADAKLTAEEEIGVFAEYIPQYFEDDAPLSIMLGGAFMYTPGEPEWRMFNEKRITEEEAGACPSCGVLAKNFYIGADGMAAPCMGMADCGFAENFPNLKDIPLREILSDSEFVRLSCATVGDVRSHNPKCRECRFADRCTGGCRNSVLMQGDDYYGIDTNLCAFFENGWDERIRRAAEPAFREYIRRNPPKEEKHAAPEMELPIC